MKVPHSPGLNVEPVAATLRAVLANHTFDADTVLIGHSGGAALLLALTTLGVVTVGWRWSSPTSLESAPGAPTDRHDPWSGSPGNPR
jgi:hypothetical protein